MPRVSVVLPTYNERDNIADLIRAIQSHLDDVEVVVVDDDSPDGTWRVVESLAGRDASIRLLHRRGQRGLTSALNEGIAMTRGEVVAWMDCDFSMPPATLPALVGATQTADIAIGSRYAPGARDARDSRLAVILSWLINHFAALLLGPPVRDYTTGFVAARRRVFDAVTLHGDYGEYCIDFLYRAKQRGFTTQEIPYTCVPRRAGQSKTGLNLWDYLRKGWKYVVTIVALRLRMRE